ncbi:tripartite motif-containing protein 39 [Pelomyxa schiedti]|nr:tripartite motif-containing protein 39 [Pelomyxa schiedti]
MLFCESCFHIRHKAPGIKSHKGQPIPMSPVLTEEHMCPKHPKKDLDLFCLEEREPICALCAFSSAHSAHKCVPLDEVTSQIRESLLKSVALESEAIKKCEASILESEQLLHSITSNVESEKEAILHSIKQNLHDVVADCTLLSSLIESHLKEHKECLEVCMSTHKRTITIAHEIAKSNDVVSLIAADKKLKETLSECTQLTSSGAMTPCLSAKNVMHHVNTQALRQVLNNNFASVRYTYHQPPKTNIADVKVDSKALCVKIPQTGSKSKSSSESKSGSGKGNRGLKIGIGLPKLSFSSSSSKSGGMVRKAKVDMKPDVKVDMKPFVKGDMKPDVKVDMKPDVKVDMKPDVKVDMKPFVKGHRKPKVAVKTGAKATVKTHEAKTKKHWWKREITPKPTENATRPTGAITTRGQLGALAAGATVNRCGANSPMQRVMGRDHASSFLRILWFDVVLPTIRLFVLDVCGLALRDGALRQKEVAVSFALSPLLMSIFREPSSVPPLDFSPVYKALPLWASSPSSHNQIRDDSTAYNTKWVASVGNFVRRGKEVISGSLTVAPLMGGAISTGRAPHCDVERAVVVDMPMVNGCITCRAFVDQSVDCEVVVAQVTQSCVVVVVVDMEETCESKKLAVLSTTRCEFPSEQHNFYSVVVMRNWDDLFSPAYGSRTFLVKLSWNRLRFEILHFPEAAISPKPTVIQSKNVEDVFRLSDSLFCVSCCRNTLQESFSIYHRENPAHPLTLGQLTSTSRKRFHVTAESGFIFNSFSTIIEVIEPTSGCVILVINCPGFQHLSIATPSSFWWH